MAELLVDTDVLVDHLRTGSGFDPSGHSVNYSVITRAELFAGRGTDEAIVRRLLSPFRELPVDRAIAELAGRLRRETGVGSADALIAATALQHRLSVLTRNTRHFERVPRLRLLPAT
jgi:predicted nucleic acid-binding protein